MTMAPTDSPEGLRPPGGRPRDEDRRTRKPLAFWDRVKFLLLLTVFWFILLWATKSGNPLVTWSDAFRIEARSGAWVLVLIGLEVLRQIHFLISEHWAGYHYFWTHRVLGGTERVTHRKLSDWTRFRLWRLITWVFWIAVLAVMLGRVKHTTPLDALFNLPGYVWSALPFVLQIMTAIIFIVIQFAALFWFLSRGGVDVYCPDDIKTRFTDVWGQDHVLERVKENILYLEDPEQIESRGGYVPGGILLWGPPGTGKTLMAEAGAGETGRPYVFVDPGAFINMFMGVGILKVKSLFRKLCRLALRYGGLIVFFDEADSLGRRGALAQDGPNFPGGGRATPAAWQAGGCHGFSYLSDDVQWRLARRALSSSAGEEPDTRRNKQMMGMGMGMGMGGGGGMGTLEALLTELSGLKKPRGFVNRNVRRLLGLRPKPPPKYRMLAGHDGRAGCAPTRATSPRSGTTHRGAGGQARDHHPVRDWRHHQGPGQRGPHHRHPGRPGRHHLGRRHPGQAAQGAGTARGRGVHRAGAARGGDPRGVPCPGCLPHPAAHGDRHRDHREGQ